ncbi:MAG: hypothetical protein GYA36_16605 [Veillonellaceae bacterium]|nr:hypothetical protein [Veillonellaceae bacterium]
MEKIEAVPHIRQHINSIIDLASTEHGISPPDESAALTARVIELRDTPGPDGKIRTWRTIAEICGTTLDAVRHRYGKGKATIRKSRTVEEAHVEPFLADTVVSRHPKIETESLPEVELANLEKPPEQEKKPDEVATIREFRAVEKPAPLDPDAFNVAHLSTSGEFATIREIGLAGKPVDAVGAGVLEERPEVRTVEKPAPLDPETLIEVDATLNLKTLAEVDRMLGEGMTVKEISAELEKNKKHVPWTSIRARAAYLAKMKRKEAKPESQEVEATDARPEPVAISRKELDLRIWDMWRAGKTLDEISDILYSEGLYYSAKSVRVRLLSQGAKL